LVDDDQRRLGARSGADGYTLKATDPIALLETVLETTEYWASVHDLPRGRRCRSA